jgi:hypothetical protein
MELLQAGVDRSVIALWLGHESVETTQIYLEANLELKEKALSKTTRLNTIPRRLRRSVCSDDLALSGTLPDWVFQRLLSGAAAGAIHILRRIQNQGFRRYRNISGNVC